MHGSYKSPRLQISDITRYIPVKKCPRFRKFAVLVHMTLPCRVADAHAALAALKDLSIDPSVLACLAHCKCSPRTPLLNADRWRNLRIWHHVQVNAQGGAIVLYGDSITGMIPVDGLPSTRGKRPWTFDTTFNRSVINLGVPYDTWHSALLRAWMVPSVRPSAIFVMLGINDLGVNGTNLRLYEQRALLQYSCSTFARRANAVRWCCRQCYQLWLTRWQR